MVSKPQPAEKDHLSVAKYSIPGRKPKTVMGHWKPRDSVPGFSQFQVLYISSNRIHCLLRGYSAARLKVTFSRLRTACGTSLPLSLNRLTGLLSQILL